VLAEAGVRTVCVDLTDVLGHGAAAHLWPLRSPAGPLLVPVDQTLQELVWSDGGYAARTAYRATHLLTARRHQAWAVDGAPYDPGRAAAQARADAADFVARAAGRLRDGGLGVVAVDTELLGHHWHEGVRWLAAVLAEADAAGLPVRPLDDAVGDVGPVADGVRELPVTSWGTPRDLATWSAPAAGGLAWRQRAAELQAVRFGSDVPDRALRELLALQSSDWAFLHARRTAGRYPAERAAGHEAAFYAALAAPGDHAPALRNLAPHLGRAALAAP
jgi:1,4-alpha-glucan branching enzyme